MTLRTAPTVAIKVLAEGDHIVLGDYKLTLEEADEIARGLLEAREHLRWEQDQLRRYKKLADKHVQRLSEGWTPATDCPGVLWQLETGQPINYIDLRTGSRLIKPVLPHEVRIQSHLRARFTHRIKSFDPANSSFICEDCKRMRPAGDYIVVDPETETRSCQTH